MTGPDRIVRADALDWLAAQPGGKARAVIFDPPYSVGTPVRGREDGAAGGVFGPFWFLHRTLKLSPGPCYRRHRGHLHRLAADARP